MAEGAKQMNHSSEEAALIEKWSAYGAFVKWSAQRSLAELEELDKYSQEKIRDLVTKFRIIAESANTHTKSVQDKKNTERIMVQDQVITYAQAIQELDNLTAKIAEGGIMTDQQYKVRDKIKILSKAVYQHAQTHEQFTEQTLSATQNINGYIKDIIIAFQFQDFVKQRMEHLSMVLQSIEEETLKMVDLSKAYASGADNVPDEMAQKLLGKFFLSKVKENFLSGLDADTASHMDVKIEEDDDDVILF